jgi:hypothetical protein
MARAVVPAKSGTRLTGGRLSDERKGKPMLPHHAAIQPVSPTPEIPPPMPGDVPQPTGPDIQPEPPPPEIPPEPRQPDIGPPNPDTVPTPGPDVIPPPTSDPPAMMQ